MSPKRPPTDGNPPEDKTSETPTSGDAPPSLRVVPGARAAGENGGPPPPRAKRMKRDGTEARSSGSESFMTREKYERAAELYLLGNRTVNGLSKALGVARGTSLRLIKRGYPAHKWPALKDRAELFDREREKQAERANRPSQLQMDEMGRWVTMREENLNMHRAVRALASKAVLAINTAVGTATAERYVTISKVVQMKGKGGRTIERVVNEIQKLPPYLPHIVQSMRALSNVAAQSGSGEAFWAKITVPEHLKGASTGWDKLAPDELEYIIANGGKLPRGVTVEQLRQRT